MLRMRLCAALVLTAAGMLLLAAAPASADTFCSGPETNPYYGGCDATYQGLRPALDAATAHPGPDTVLIPAGASTFETGLDYSDGGDASNAVTLQGAGSCERYGCGQAVLTGGTPSHPLLSFSGGGGAEVKVIGLALYPTAGATGIVLPPGAEMHGAVSMDPGSTGIRMEGTAARPALFAGNVSGGDLAVDAPGHGILERTRLSSTVGARIRDGGMLDIRDGEINAPIGVVGSRALVTGTWMNPIETTTGASTPRVAFSAECAGPNSPDAELTLANVTLASDGSADSVGARALARGGDGESCAAAVRVNSTAIFGVATALEARGENGSGADARDGVARIDARYSAFDASRTTSVGPAEIETVTPGGNVFGAPQFHRDTISSFPYLRWDSPLIDRGDPAEPESWQRDFIPVIHGRRDIGMYEYGFQAPMAQIGLTPHFPPHNGELRIGVRARVTLSSYPFDNDPGDPMATLFWKLSDGSTSTAHQVVRRYAKPGRYEERLTATDVTGLSSEAAVTITVARQRVTGVRVYPSAFRPGSRLARGRVTVEYALSVPGRVGFRVEKAVPRRGRRHGRWVRLRGRFADTGPAGHSEIRWRGWIGGHPLRPGLYRLVASAPPGPPRRARFRIIR
jgi:hypothetical protein